MAPLGDRTWLANVVLEAASVAMRKPSDKTCYPRSATLRSLRFLISTAPRLTYAVSAVRPRERRRDEILRRMRHPARGAVSAVRCPQCARSEILWGVWHSPRAWRIVSAPFARCVHAQAPR